MRRYLCGVPEHKCLGSRTMVNALLATDGQSRKTHSLSEDAFHCMVNHLLVDLGYTQIGPREFVRGADEPILVLAKPSRFGAKLRRGKKGQRTQPVRGCGVIVG